MRLDHDELRKKYDELTQVFKDKNRKLLQTQELYDKLKRKAMLGQMQGAAEDAVDSTLNAASGGLANFMNNNASQGPYPEPGTPYGQPQTIMHGQPRVTQSYQPSGVNQGQGVTWFRTAGAQCGQFITMIYREII